jgi:hypothetical protein
MIHVATVHWRSDRWIDLQHRYLDRYLGGAPYRVYAFLNDVPGDHAGKFFYTSSESIVAHATKLNLLADVIHFSAGDPSDVLVFIDGDAFPIAPLAPLLRERLERHKLIAVQRHENNGDMQPHPCFCATTVGFWDEIDGDWHQGHKWLDLQGVPVTDVGGNLLESLDSSGIDWYPLRRLNKRNPHRLFFGVYGDQELGALVYHHGAGFRIPISRVSVVEHGGRELKAGRTARILSRLPKSGVLGRARERYHPVSRLRRRLADEAELLSEEVIGRIEESEAFWREL